MREKVEVRDRGQETQRVNRNEKSKRRRRRSKAGVDTAEKKVTQRQGVNRASPGPEAPRQHPHRIRHKALTVQVPRQHLRNLTHTQSHTRR